MFVNLSNHPHTTWPKEQLQAAMEYGTIIDVIYPGIPSTENIDQVKGRVTEMIDGIIEMHPDVVLCQGEMTSLVYMVNRLLDKNIKVVAACSDRDVLEMINEDGSVIKTAVFRFKGFREYAR